MGKKLIGKNSKEFSNLIGITESLPEHALNQKPTSLTITAVIRTKGGTGEFTKVESLISASERTKILVATLNPDSRYTTLGLEQQSLTLNKYQNSSAIICEDWMRNDVLNRIFKHTEENDVAHLILTVGTGSAGGLLERVRRAEKIANTIYITLDSKIDYCIEIKRMLMENKLNQGKKIIFADQQHRL